MDTSATPKVAIASPNTKCSTLDGTYKSCPTLFCTAKPGVGSCTASDIVNTLDLYNRGVGLCGLGPDHCA